MSNNNHDKNNNNYDQCKLITCNFNDFGKDIYKMKIRFTTVKYAPCNELK